MSDLLQALICCFKDDSWPVRDGERVFKFFSQLTAVFWTKIFIIAEWSKAFESVRTLAGLSLCRSLFVSHLLIVLSQNVFLLQLPVWPVVILCFVFLKRAGMCVCNKCFSKNSCMVYIVT